MTRTTERLLELARRNATVYAEHPKVEAIFLAGSVARGIADEFSDIDTIVCCSTMFTEEERLEAMQRNNGSDRLTLGDEEGGMDQYTVDGVGCQFGLGTTGMFEEHIAAVIERFDTDHDRHVIMGGLRHAIPLYGDETVARWKSSAESYPEGLTTAMVRNHLSFRPLRFLEHRLAGRDDYFQFHEALIAAERRILGVLLGLNRLYPEHHFKRLGNLIERMEIIPDGLSERLRQILQRPPSESLAALGRLIDDTFGLVARHLPTFDATEAHARYLGETPQPSTRS